MTSVWNFNLVNIASAMFVIMLSLFRFCFFRSSSVSQHKNMLFMQSVSREYLFNDFLFKLYYLDLYKLKLSAYI